ncbi:MAG TPA: GNAT family N-acetyltransferase [Clostridium sp.]|nr:GNAT family N-acetyltransferase [Clostridium sp.]
MDFYIKQSNKDMQINEVKKMLEKSYWASHRNLDTIKKSIENSICYGVFLKDSNKQIGFARVITDFATTYYICDVIVNEEYRGHGIGKTIVKTITSDDRFKNLGGMLLTADAHGLYEQFGFKQVDGKYMSNK